MQEVSISDLEKDVAMMIPGSDTVPMLLRNEHFKDGETCETCETGVVEIRWVTFKIEGAQEKEFYFWGEPSCQR